MSFELDQSKEDLAVSSANLIKAQERLISNIQYCLDIYARNQQFNDAANYSALLLEAVEVLKYLRDVAPATN
jgi:hypothetical protein